MKISVVVPVLNEEESLPYLLDSLASQEFPRDEFEVIVVDNNSTDKSAQIAGEYGAIVLHEVKQGIVYARNRGVKATRGEIIVGTDADCILPKNFLKTIAIRFSGDKNLAGLCGSITLFNAPVIIRVLAYVISITSHNYAKIVGKTPICWALNFSFRKDAFEEAGGYNLDLPLLTLGINTDGSDEFDLVGRLEQTGGKVLFDKDIILQSSGRRFKGRLFYWFFVEFLIGFYLNKLLYETTGYYIPIPSYFERIKPKAAFSLIEKKHAYVGLARKQWTVFQENSLYPQYIYYRHKFSTMMILFQQESEPLRRYIRKFSWKKW